MRLNAALIVAAVTVVFVIFPVYSKNNEDDDIKWQTVSKELDALPFRQSFKDSVIKAHIGGSDNQHKLRKVNSSIIKHGETLVYEIGWGPFKAGFLILSVERRHNSGLIRLSGKMMSNNFVSGLYKIRNQMVSWIDSEGFYPIFFEDHAREGKKYSTDSYSVFDNKNGKIYYKKKGDATEYDTPPFTQDYMSMLHYARLMPLNPGSTFTIDMFSVKKTYPFRFKVHSKLETIKTDAGTFVNCARVEPTILGDGKVFAKGDKMEVWVSNDTNKYPVRVKSKAKIGSITANLIHISNNAP